MNEVVFSYFGQSDFWDTVSWVTLILILLAIAGFAFLGLKQWIKRKNLLKVDKELLWMIPIFILMIVINVFFERVLIINYRPIMLDGIAEPSFPSSHTLLATTCGLLMMIVLPKYVKNKKQRILFDLVCGILIFLTGFGRMASGMHWATDVLGAFFFGGILAIIYAYLLKITKEKKIE